MIHLLINQESFQFDRHFKRLIDKLIDKNNREFNFDRVSAENAAASQIINLCDTLPLACETRLVVVDDAQLLKKDDVDVLTAYLKKPNPSCHVIFTATKIDKRTAFYKTLAAAGEVVEFLPLYDNKVLPFVIGEAKSLGLEPKPGSLELLFDKVGNDLMSLVMELEKLKLYVAPGKVITTEHVEKLIGLGNAVNVFTISELLAKKKLDELSAISARLFDQGESPIMLVALIIGHFRKLMLTKESVGAGRSDDSLLASLLKIPPFVVKNYLAQSRNFSIDQLKSIYKRLLDLSIALRSGGAGPETGFYRFIQTVCLAA